MNIPRSYTYEINHDHCQYFLEEANRERLANIARAANAKPSRIIKVINIFQRMMQRSPAPEQQVSPVSEVASP